MQVSSSSESLLVIDSGEELPEISISRTRSLDTRVKRTLRKRVNRRTLRSPTWRIGANAPTVKRGSGGLGAQAQLFFANVVHNITPLRSQLGALFGKHSHMSSHALAAVLCGISRHMARRAAKNILERGAVAELECRPGPGRKR